MRRDLVPIDKAGRIVLPKPLRQKLGLLSGDKLELSVEGNTIKLVPAGGGGGFVRKGSVLVFRGLEGSIGAAEIEELIHQGRETRMEARKETENE